MPGINSKKRLVICKCTSTIIRLQQMYQSQMAQQMCIVYSYFSGQRGKKQKIGTTASSLISTMKIWLVVSQNYIVVIEMLCCRVFASQLFTFWSADFSVTGVTIFAFAIIRVVSVAVIVLQIGIVCCAKFFSVARSVFMATVMITGI